jgi:hypothetical protein
LVRQLHDFFYVGSFCFVTASANKHSTLNLVWNSFGVESPGGGGGGRRALGWAVIGKFKPQRSHRPLRLTFLIVASCQGFLLLGYDQGVMSGFIGANNQFAHEYHQPDAKRQGIITTSIYDIGYAAGALLNFSFDEQFGRKNMIISGGTTMIVGTILLGSSNTLAQLLFGRIVTSIGNGFNSSTLPMYQYEMCKPSNRGILLNLQGTVTIIGLCIAYWLDFRSLPCKRTHPRTPLHLLPSIPRRLPRPPNAPPPRDTTLPD